jgi:hypothetical protein
MPTFSFSVDKIAEYTPFFFGSLDNVYEQPFDTIGFTVAEEEIENVRSVMAQYGLDLTLLTDVLWFYNLIKNADEYAHDAKALELIGHDENYDIIELAQRKGDNWKHGELLFGFYDKEISKKVLANLKEYEALMEVIKGHLTTAKEVQKITFYTNDSKVEVFQPALIESLFDNIFRSVNEDALLLRMERLKSKRSKTAIKQTLPERGKRLMAYYFHLFLTRKTTLGKEKGRNKLGAYLFGAHLMFIAGVEFPSNPEEFTGREAELMKDNFKSWVNGYFTPWSNR